MQENAYCNRNNELRPSSPLYTSRNGQLSDEAFEAVVDDIINDVILNVCFQAHKSFKKDFFRTVGDDDDKVLPEDIFGQIKGKTKISSIYCPHCEKKSEPSKFASHLDKCMVGNGRQSSRNARQKLNADAMESDEDDGNESDASYTSGKRTKKKLGKNIARKRVAPVQSSFENAVTYDDFQILFGQFCGVPSKHTKKMCNNTLKCSQHTNEQRQVIRNKIYHNFLTEQRADNGQIDVDTVDEENIEVFLRQTSGLFPET